MNYSEWEWLKLVLQLLIIPLIISIFKYHRCMEIRLNALLKDQEINDDRHKETKDKFDKIDEKLAKVDEKIHELHRWWRRNRD